MNKKKEFKKIVKAKYKKAKQDFMKKLCSLAATDPKGYWSLIRKLKK
jgi:hypothetical protein